MDPFTILGLGSAAAGIVGNLIGSGQKASGVAANNAAKAKITQDQLNSIMDQNDKAHEIAQWYNGQSQGLADQTDANSKGTIAGADGGAFTTARAGSEASRAASGNALVDSLTPATNYSDNAPDASGTVKSENARKLVQALDFGHAKANAGAAVNSYGDALLGGGLAIQKGNEGQAVINRDQNLTDKVATLRSNLNTNTHQPILSPSALYDLTAPVGSGDFQSGQLLQTGGNVLSALGANGVGSDAFNGLFAGAVPSKAGVMGPQVPGLFGNLFG